MRFPRHFPARGLLAAALLGGTACLAGVYTVDPVSMTLSTSAPQGEFRVLNENTRTLRLQADVERWTQDANENVQAPSTDFIVSPRFVDVPAQGGQTVRIAWRHPQSKAIEGSYRVMFREVMGPDDSRAVHKTALNYSIPLFVEPSAGGNAVLAWTAFILAPRQVRLRVENRGAVHAKLAWHALQAIGNPGVELAGEEDFTALTRVSPMRYVLAGAYREFDMPVHGKIRVGDQLSLWVDIDGIRKIIVLTAQ
ncbi:MAG: molecular chaperone [Bacillota bacterium]